MNETDVDHAIAEADKIQLRYSIDTLTLGPTVNFLGYMNQAVISASECRILTIGDVAGETYSISSMCTGAIGYCDKLCIYQERFGTPMPVALRKHLLYQVYDL